MSPYTPQTWNDHDITKPVSAARMTVIENGIATAQGFAESTTPTYHAARYPTVQAAIDAASTAGGGEVVLAETTYRVNLTAKANVRVRGAGVGKTILKAVAGSNDDVVKGANFATLTGKTKATGDYALGCPNFELADLTIDGDKSTQSSGWGVRIWGRAPRFCGQVEIRNCKSGGLWTEFTEVDSFADPAQVLEGSADSLKIHGCDGHGWVHRGPHDFVAKSVEIWSNTGHGLRLEALLQDGTTYNGGLVVHLLNCYLNSGGSVYHDGSQFECAGGQFTCESGVIGLETTAATGGMKIDNVFIGGAAAGTNVGLHLRGSTHRVGAQVSRSGTGVKLDGAINCSLDLYGSANTTAINNVSEAGPNFIHGLFDVPGGGALTSGAALNSLGLYMLKGYNGVSTAIQQLPSATLKAAGWSPQLPASNGVLIPGGVTSATYGATVTPNAATAIMQRINVTDANAFTIAAPTNDQGWPLTLEIFNNTAGAMGAITWNAAYKMEAWTNPAAGKHKTITFQQLGGSWWQIGKPSGDL